MGWPPDCHATIRRRGRYRVVTPPRIIIAHQTWFVTVRAVSRTFRFVPRPRVRAVMEYVLAATAQKFADRIHLHEYEFLSNHFHLLLTDVGRCLPEFMQDLDSALATALNAIHGTSGSCIEKGYNAVAVQDADKVLEHAVYTLANACSAHLVQRTRHWCGLSSLRRKYGHAFEVRRPKDGKWKYTDEQERSRHKRKRRCVPMNAARERRRSRTTMPAVAVMQLVRPPIFPELSDAELRRCIAEKLDQRERELIEQRRRDGTKVLGMARVEGQKYWMSPESVEDIFRTRPSVSARSKWARIDALGRREKFMAAYRCALEAFCAGQRDVVFPRGTWLMRQRFGVRCHSPP